MEAEYANSSESGARQTSVQDYARLMNVTLGVSGRH